MELLDHRVWVSSTLTDNTKLFTGGFAGYCLPPAGDGVSVALHPALVSLWNFSHSGGFVEFLLVAFIVISWFDLRFPGWVPFLSLGHLDLFFCEVPVQVLAHFSTEWSVFVLFCFLLDFWELFIIRLPALCRLYVRQILFPTLVLPSERWKCHFCRSEWSKVGNFIWFNLVCNSLFLC